MAVLFIFIDGVGLGKAGEVNPLDVGRYSFLREMSGGQLFTDAISPVDTEAEIFKGIDACLGVEGLPQSGTGQTTLFSGKNAPKITGRHFGPFPYSTTKFLLQQKSLFHKVQALGYSCHFLNAYPDIFFKKSAEQNRWTCTTLMTKSAGITLNRVADIKKGKALTADIMQQLWRKKLHIQVPEIPPQKASERALLALENYDLVLYEYFLTDKAGHNQKQAFAHEILSTLDAFLIDIFNNIDKPHSLILTSDHGNLEDLSVKTHTFNEVPLYVKGPMKRYFKDARSLLDVTPGIVRYLREK